MKYILLIIFSFFSSLITAQDKKGESIYKSFRVSNFDFQELIEGNCNNWMKLKVNGDFVSEKKIITTQRFEIGHINPSPFIAFSCKWLEKTGADIEIAFRFSDRKGQSNEDENNQPFFKPIKLDNHYEGNDGYKVSELIFIDKKYTHFEIKIKGNTTSTGYMISNLLLNFFNPQSTQAKRFEGCIYYGRPEKKTENQKLVNFPISQNHLTNFNWEKQLKLDYTGDNNLATQQQQVNNNQSITQEDNATQRPSACPCTLPGYTTRNQWNCPQGQGLVSGVGTSPAVTHLIVHHSAGANTATDWNAVVLSIWNFHTGTNGYSDIGYNWLVAPNGQLYEGRGSNSLTQNVTGAHFCGTNANTMGVCMIGTYTSTDITAAARSTLTKLLAWKCCQQNIPPSGTALHTSSNLTLNRISGHRDGCATECPGTQFYGTLAALRSEVQNSIDTCGSAVPCTPSLKVSFTGCPNNTLSFTPTNIVNGGNAPIYNWYLNNNLVVTGNSYVLNNAVNGDKVYARMTSNASCANNVQVNSDTATISCIVTTSVITINGLEYCKISPNPNNGYFTVMMQLNKNTLIQYKIYDASGKQIHITHKERVIGVINQSFQLKNLSDGMYFLEIQFDGKPFLQKIMIHKN